MASPSLAAMTCIWSLGEVVGPSAAALTTTAVVQAEISTCLPPCGAEAEGGDSNVASQTIHKATSEASGGRETLSEAKDHPTRKLEPTPLRLSDLLGTQTVNRSAHSAVPGVYGSGIAGEPIDRGEMAEVGLYVASRLVVCMFLIAVVVSLRGRRRRQRGPVVTMQ